LKAFANGPAKAELASMLPGFRFLFAAIVLSMSILVFGLGAAALLRAAHEEFASNPSWHASPEPVFVQRNETQGPVYQAPVIQEPVLAMLHIEPPAADEKTPDQVAAATTPAEQPATSAIPAEPEVTAKPSEPKATATPAEPEVTTIPAAAPESTVALLPENSSPPETTKPEMPAAESPAQQEAAPAQAVAPAAADETKLAASTSATASEEVSAPTSEATPATPDQAGPPASADADSASTKIATLGGPAVTIEAAPPVKTTVERHVRSVIKKRVEARRKTRHRRTASRVRVVQQLPQQSTDPFGQSFAAARRR
jgi:hypothetical protein